MTAARARVGLLTALLLAPAGVGAQQRPAQQPATPERPTFRSSVDVVSVAAVVRDRKGRFVSGLAQKDFEVIEGGEPRRILDFRAQADGPVKLALLVDISGSMRVGAKAVDARQAARHLFGALRGGDQAALFTFDTRLELAHGFTSDLAALDAALDTVEPPFGQTSLYDAVAETARAAASEGTSGGQLPQRRAVVVLTDGIDTHSRLTPAQVSAIASGIDIPVYIIAVMATVDDPSYREAGETGLDASSLRELAQWTGGELFTATAPAHASVAARQIVGELRHQYLLAVEASTRAGWRPLEVRAKRGDLVVRSRSGYTAGSGRTS
jgi:Ca-activated chloride channel family protein